MTLAHLAQVWRRALPPLRGDAFRPLDGDDLVHGATPAQAQGRAIRTSAIASMGSGGSNRRRGRNPRPEGACAGAGGAPRTAGAAMAAASGMCDFLRPVAQHAIVPEKRTLMR